MLTGTGTHGPNETTVYAVLRQDGDRVTGSVGPDKAHQLAIRNCRIEGSAITGETVKRVFEKFHAGRRLSIRQVAAIAIIVSDV
jgi:hypothetical protein